MVAEMRRELKPLQMPPERKPARWAFGLWLISENVVTELLYVGYRGALLLVA